MSHLKIRMAEEKDVEAIAALEKVCFPTEPWSREMVYEEIKNNPRAAYMVAEVEEKLVGYGGLWKIGDEGHITNVAVDPLHRKKQIGKGIVTVLLRETEKLGIESWTLEVRKTNEVALSMYAKLGFQEVGLRKGYYIDNGEDAVIMWKVKERE